MIRWWVFSSIRRELSWRWALFGGTWDYVWASGKVVAGINLIKGIVSVKFLHPNLNSINKCLPSKKSWGVCDLKTKFWQHNVAADGRGIRHEQEFISKNFYMKIFQKKKAFNKRKMAYAYTPWRSLMLEMPIYDSEKVVPQSFTARCRPITSGRFLCRVLQRERLGRIRRNQAKLGKTGRTTNILRHKAFQRFSPSVLIIGYTFPAFEQKFVFVNCGLIWSEHSKDLVFMSASDQFH